MSLSPYVFTVIDVLMHLIYGFCNFVKLYENTVMTVITRCQKTL